MTAPARVPRGRGAASPQQLGYRIASSAVLAGAALATAFVGGTAFEAFWGLAAALVAAEWVRLVRPPDRFAAMLAAAAILLAAAAWSVLGPAAALLALLAGAAGLVAAAGLVPAAAVPYAAPIALAPALLRDDPLFGLAAVTWLFAVVWGTDIAAYVAGRAIGGPRLWPAVSPGKTWAGAFGGAAAAVVAGTVVAISTGAPRAWPVAILSLAASAVAQAGDLFELGLKRRFGAKDSGRLIPGHGGLMDRLDGFTAAAAFAALVGLVRSGVGAAGEGLLAW